MIIFLRHPSQIYEAIFEGIILFLLLNFFRKKFALKKPGLVSSFFLIFYSIFRFILEFYRAPDPQIGYLLFHLTFGQILSLFFIVWNSHFCEKKRTRINKILTMDKFINEAFIIKKWYYMKKNPFGEKGDYITSPNISILFSEMIAIWTISFWENLELSKKFNLIELGGGNGEMIKQMLRTFEKFPSFNNK